MAGFDYDILIIGGGINGCGIARDAAGRGYRVLLSEAGDLAGGTSSASTKLIHGGLRYLEHYEFRLVREALTERELLWRMAPHIIRPLRFVLPHHRGLRPAWLLRLGLFLYDHIGGRKLLPATKGLDLAHDPAGAPLHSSYRRAFEYSDARVDDARLVVLNARDAADRGARILTRSPVRRVERRNGGFAAEIQGENQVPLRVTARLVVNATGPWVDDVIGRVIGRAGERNVRLVQGSHIVVPRLFDHDRAYIFQNADGRIIFAIPYETDFTLIGTTDRDYDGPPERVNITEAEIRYLCAAAGEYFRAPPSPRDVVWSYAGIRPLYETDAGESAQRASRDYVLRTDGDGESGAIIDIFGGKITTYRRLAEAVLAEIARLFKENRPAWTAGTALPGGDFDVNGFEDLVARLRSGAPGVAEATLRRLARAYGMKARAILGDKGELGRIIGADLGENEVRYLIENEWALSAEDILWRRSKLGLRLRPDEAAALSQMVAELSGERRDSA